MLILLVKHILSAWRKARLWGTNIGRPGGHLHTGIEGAEIKILSPLQSIHPTTCHSTIMVLCLCPYEIFLVPGILC